MVVPNGAGSSSPPRYLRLLLEEELAGGEGEGARFAGALGALVAAGVLAPAAAAALAVDASLALVLRGRLPLVATGAGPAGAGAVQAASPGGDGAAAQATRHGEPSAQRYLWQLITGRLARLLIDGSADRSGDADPAVDALVACGVINPDDPLAAQALLTDAVALGFGDEEALAPRIRSVLDARDHLGASGGWAVGGTAFTVDGHVVRLDTVTADGAQLVIVGHDHHRGGAWGAAIDLTATDDQGNWYVGLPTRQDDGTATWVVVPSLDPEAGQLVLTVSGPSQSASWSVDLA